MGIFIYTHCSKSPCSVPPSDLPPRQAEILAFIQGELREGMSPTLAEICAEFGFRSVRAAAKLVEKLERRGAIERLPGSRRGIRVPGLRPGGSLPLIGRVAAGAPILAAENVESHHPVNPELFRPRADFLFRVKGLSMRDAGILDGDLVAVHEQPEAHNGQIVVARLPGKRVDEDEITLKRYYRKGHRILLKPENSDFQPLEIDLARFDPDSQERPPLTIVGLYAGLIRGSAAP